MCCGVSVLAMSLAAILAEQSTSAELFATAMAATGPEYVAAREALLELPKEQVRALLKQKK